MKEFVSDDDIPLCTQDASAGQFYRLPVDDLRPTQFATGKGEVLTRAARMRKKYQHDPDTLRDYLRVRPVPVILRAGSCYLVDHHHLVRGLYEALHEEVGKGLTVYVEVLANYGAISTAHFWKQMFKSNWVYLFDRAGGGPQRPEDLPAHIKELGFDPYRSLAWIVREHHGYFKNDAPFSEFKWANFFRTNILLDQDILAGTHTFDDFAFEVDKYGKLVLSDDGEEIIHDAISLALGPDARGLPGYRGTA